jgi:Amt family ammonium transporter
LAENFHLPAFLDAGGGATIQVTGGIAALSVAWILRARRGKYISESTGSAIPTAIPGHNIVMVLFGCLLALVGWLALDAACSMLFYGLAIDQVPGVLINATLCASAACMAAVAVTQYRYRKPDASISANGFVAGLVAGSSSCAYISPLSAILTGLMAGLIVTYTVELLELKLLIDDPGGAISVHLIAGIWGILATGLFVSDPNGLQSEHILSQLIGIATLLGLILPIIHGANLILNRFVPYRVDRDGDWQGMDIRELGSGAYPEFVIHADEFIPRS